MTTLENDSPAVNHAGGIARLLGDDALYARILGRFRSDYRQAAAAIRAALDSGDMPLALRIVHTLKGAAGMIEAVPLRCTAQELEQLLRRNAGNPYGHLARLEQALDRVLRELDAVASVAPPPPVPVHPSATAFDGGHGHTNEHERLARLLDDGNGDAVELVRDAEAALKAHLGTARYRRLAELIETFDFDGALALLKTPPAAG